MISVIIATKDSERALVPTLGALIPGASAGLVREVIVADAGSQDQTAAVGDVAGCHVLVSRESLGYRLKAAAATARGHWLMFLRPGIVLDATWIAEAARFVEGEDRSDGGVSRAAVFRSAPRPGSYRPALVEALSLLRLSFGGRPRPDQGLLIADPLYRALGGHAEASADPEADLVRRIGRSRLAVLRCGAMRVADGANA